MVKLSRARAEALRGEILEATAAEVSRVGFDAMALTSVAARCGLATSAIYNRFPGKEILVVALIEEHLAPALGVALDDGSGRYWSNVSDPTPGVTLDRPTTGVTIEGVAFGTRSDGEELDLPAVLHELQMAARHTPELRPPVNAFLERRLRAASRAHAEADRARGAGPRPGQDPRAQVLLRPAAAAGAYLLGLISEPPTGGAGSVDHVVGVALRKGPWEAPAPKSRAARRRKDPGATVPHGHPVDQMGEALVLSAADTFAEKGYERATVADIARRAGLTTGAIYNRFTGKAGLLNEVALQITEPHVAADTNVLVEALRARTAAAGAEAMAAIAHRNLAPDLGNERSLRMVACLAARQELEVAAAVTPAQDHELARAAAGIRAAQADSTIRSDVDAEALAWWLTALPLGFALWGEQAAAVEDWTPTFAALLRALRAHPTTP